MEASVKMLTGKFNWSLNCPAETEIKIEVDDDVAHKLKNIKVKDMGKITRGRPKDTMYLAIEWIGSVCVNNNGLASLALHLYNLKPGARRKNAKHPLDYTRAAYGI